MAYMGPAFGSWFIEAQVVVEAPDACWEPGHQVHGVGMLSNYCFLMHRHDLVRNGGLDVLTN